jgi:hypothetical protein
MPEFKIRTPDGRIVTVSGATREGAVAFLSQQERGPTVAAPAPFNTNPDGTGFDRAVRRGAFQTTSALPTALATADIRALSDREKLQSPAGSSSIKYDELMRAGVPRGAMASRGVDLEDDQGTARLMDQYNVTPQAQANYGQVVDKRIDNADSWRDTQAAAERIQSNVGSASYWQDKAAALPMSPGAEKYSQALAEAPDGFKGWLSTVTNDPLGFMTFLGETVAESTPQIAAGIATSTVTGNPLAGAAVMSLGGLGREYSNEVNSFLKDNGIDLSDPAQANTLFKNPELMDQANERGLTRGLVIAAADFAGQGLVATQIIKKSLARQTVAQSTSEASGEALATRAVGDNFSFKDTITEGLAGGASAIPEAVVAGNPIWQKRYNAENTEYRSAASDLARLLRSISDAEGLNLKDVNTQGAAKQTLEAAHEQISGQIKAIVGAPGVRERLSPKNAKTLDQLMEDYAAAQTAVRQGKNKVKSKVTDENAQAMARLLGPTQEAGQLLNLFAQGNVLTDLFADGTKGGVSQFTDFLNPLQNDGSGGFNVYRGINVLGGVAGATQFGIPATAGIVAGGRLLDAATGRRSKVNRFVKKNEKLTGQAAPEGPSLIAAAALETQQADQAKIDEAAQKAAKAEQKAAQDTLDANTVSTLAGMTGNATDGSPLGTIAVGTGIDPQEIQTVVSELRLKHPADSKKPEDVAVNAALDDAQAGLNGEQKPIVALTQLVNLINNHLNADLLDGGSSVQRTSLPDQPLAQAQAIQRGNVPTMDAAPVTQQASAAPQTQSQAPAQPMVQTNGNLTTSNANYEAGKQANMDAVVQMQTSVLQAPNLPQAEQEALFDALEVAMQPATEPLVAMQEIEQSLLSQGVAQENVDTYFKPYVDRVVRQQGRKPSLLAQAQAAQEPVIKTSPLVAQAQAAQGPSIEERRQASFDELQATQGKRPPLKDSLKAATAWFNRSDNEKSFSEIAQESQQPTKQTLLTGNAAINAILDNNQMVNVAGKFAYDAYEVGKSIGGTEADGQALLDQLSEQGFIDNGFFTDEMYAATPMPAYESLLADINSRNPSHIDEKYVKETVNVNDTTAGHLLNKLRAADIISYSSVGTGKSKVLPRQSEESRTPNITPPKILQPTALGPRTITVEGQIKPKEQQGPRETNHGLMPHLRVKAEGRVGKSAVLATTKNSNAARQLIGLDEVLSRHEDPASSPEAWSAYQGDALATSDVPVQPNGFINDLNKGGAQELLGKLTPGQIADADHGFENAAEFRRAYTNGEIGIPDTGRLFLWSFLSKGVSPYLQESMFLDSFDGIDQWIDAAANKTLKERLPEYKAWAAQTAPQGSGQPGAGAMHNLNAFGVDFLVKMSEDVSPQDKRSRLQYIHDLMSDPNMTGREIRREFAKIGEGVGIDNKVVSFTLLVAGFNDVMVMDRVQIRQMYNDGRFDGVNLYDGYKAKDPKDGKSKVVTGTGFATQTNGVKGLMLYEAMERSLGKRLPKIYEDVGRPEAASVGRYHWETWVASSEQEASHGTIDAILAKAQGDPNPLDGVTAKEGEYGAYAYGARYGLENGQPMFNYSVPDRGEFKFTVSAFQKFLEDIKGKTKRNKVIPSGFSVKQSGNAPWYTRDGVNLDALAEKANEYGKQVSRTDDQLRPDQAVPDGRTIDAPSQESRGAALTIPGGNPTPAIGPAGPRPVAPQRRPFSKVAIPSVRQFFSKAKVPFEIGKPGAKDENGIQTIDRALELSTALGMTVKLFNNQSKMVEAAGLSPRSKGSYDLKGPQKGGKGAEGTIFGLNPGAHKADGSRVAGIESLSTLLHEIGHGMTLGPMDLNSPQSNFVTFTNPVTGQQDYAPPGSFADSAIKPLLEGKGNPAILAEIDNLQQNIDTYTTNDPKQRVALRDVRSFINTITPWVAELDKKYDQAVKMGDTEYQNAIEGEYTAINEDGNAYMDYIKNVRELSVDPMVVYYMNPKLMKALAPKTAELIKSEFKKAGNKTIQFYSHPLPIVIATVMAMLAQGAAEEEEKEGSHQMPDGSMMKNSEMGNGALSPQQAPPGLLTQQAA